MYWLPARPSPIAAPIAPPPSARPPPTIAPARATACCMFSTAMCLSLLVGGRATSVALLVYGETEIDDGEQGKDQRLDAADEHVEELPDGVRQPKHVRREQPDQRDHQATGEQVAEQPQREREALRDLSEPADRDDPARRAGKAL